jgi:hypothetical protein
MQLPWAPVEDAEAEDTSADHALAVVAETTIIRLIMPSWGWKLPIKKRVPHPRIRPHINTPLVQTSQNRPEVERIGRLHAFLSRNPLCRSR